MKIKEKIRKF